MNVDVLLATLVGAASQDPCTVKESTLKLTSLEQNSGYLSGLANVYSNIEHVNEVVRLCAAMQLKHATDKFWKPRGGIPNDEKVLVKQSLLQTIPLEQSMPVAAQAALICSKIIRKDGNGSWGELFICIGQAVSSTQCNIRSKSFCALTLKELVKMMKSKRLPSDRAQFRKLGSQLWPVAAELYRTAQFRLMAAQSVEDVNTNVQIAHNGLKVLKSLSLYGSDDPAQCSQVKSLVENLLQELPSMLEHFNRLTNSKMMDTENLAKFVTIHARIICKLSEEYPNALHHILPRLLPFCAELIVNGKQQYQHIPDRLIVQSMIILKTFAMKATEEIDQDRLDSSDHDFLIIKIAKSFFTVEALVALIRHVVMDYLVLSARDLEMWETAPEEYINDEKNESWLYDIRPCSEVLLLSMVHHFSAELVPMLVDMVSEVQSSLLPKARSDPAVIFTIDAVFNAIGLTSYELFESVDFDGWFKSTLLPLLNDSKTDMKLKRRITWLCGQWVTVKFSAALRPELYNVLLNLISPTEDLVVRLESALCLKYAIDDFSFECEQFVPFQEIACTRLFELLRDCNECDTKMRILYIYSLILKRMRGKTVTAINQLADYLPQLWEHAEDHFLLRGAIVCSLLELTLSLASKSVSLYQLLLPVCATSVDPHSSAYIYLSNDGFDLWLAILQTAPASNNQILELLQVVPSVIQMGSENLKVVFQIMECYMLLDFRGFLQTNFDAIITSSISLFDDFGDECLIILVKFVNAFLTSAVVNQVQELPMTMIHLIGAIFKHFKQQPGPVLKSVMYMVASRVMLQFKYIVAAIVTQLDLNLNHFLKQWCADMDSVTHHDRRKLATLTHLEYVEAGGCDIHQLFAPIVCAALEVLSDLGTRRTNEKIEDNLVLTSSERTELQDKNTPSEPSELWVDIWRRKTQLQSIAYNVNLVKRIITVLEPFKSTALYQGIDESVRKQLENLLDGKTEGWGSADRDDIFIKSGGERLATDAWH